MHINDSVMIVKIPVSISFVTIAIANLIQVLIDEIYEQTKITKVVINLIFMIEIYVLIMVIHVIGDDKIQNLIQEQLRILFVKIVIEISILKVVTQLIKVSYFHF